MTSGEYNQHVTRCAQMVLALHPGNKTAAKAACTLFLQGLRGHIVGSNADAISILRYSSNPNAASGVNLITDAAWEAHLADVRAKIDTLP